jgi:hypothetical protein
MADLSLDLKPADIGTIQYNDLLIVNGDLTLTLDSNPNGTNPVLQNILQILRFYYGEWFLDNTKGIPWFQQILVKNPSLAKIESILINGILGVPGVTQLTEFTLTPNFAQRTLKISFKCITTKGVVIYSGNLNQATGGQG